MSPCRPWTLAALLCSFSCGGSSEPEPTAVDASTDGAVGEAPGQKRTVTAFEDVRISSLDGEPHFQRAEADVDFGPGPFASVKLVADLDTTCFPFSRWQDDPPPEGENFPPSCDAFDRNFEFTLDEPRSENEPPAFELVRAITPFGGPLHLEEDLTDLANAHPGAHRLQVFIATWSDAAGLVSGSRGGWNVSAQLLIETGTPPRRVLAATSLGNGSLASGARELASDFVLPKGTRTLRVELRSTGHGGATDEACFGPAEEFCTREHRVELDGQTLARLDLTRSDCAMLCTLVDGPGDGQHCAENPTGLPASVRAPRAGWCPGSVVPPRTWTLDARTNEDTPHDFRYVVDRIAEGGSYRVSATLYAFGD